MKPGKIASFLLLGFVGFSVAMIVVKELRQPEGAAAAPAVGQALSDSGQGDQADAEKVVVYYFHGEMRCRTCREIESLSLESVRENFGSMLETGEMEWREVNYDQPANRHYLTTFQLAYPALIVTTEHRGEIRRSRNLDEVWRRLPDGSESFKEYVVQGVAEFLLAGDDT